MFKLNYEVWHPYYYPTIHTQAGLTSADPVEEAMIGGLHYLIKKSAGCFTENGNYFCFFFVSICETYLHKIFFHEKMCPEMKLF